MAVSFWSEGTIKRKRLLPQREEAFLVRSGHASMMDVFTALHTIDDSADHDGKVNKDATHAHESLRGGMQGTADEFAHGIAPEGLPTRHERLCGITS